MMKNLKWLVLISVILLSVMAWLSYGKVNKAEATFHRDWSNWSSWGKWSDCKPLEKRELLVVDNGECEPIEGSQRRERTRFCQWELGGGSDKCNIGQTQTDYDYQKCQIKPECPTPTPEATPEATPTATICRENCGSPPTFAGSSTEPPQCGQASPPAVVNPHVYRNGDQAVIKWWPEGGNKVHIFYKQVSSPDWQYSVTADNTGYFVINGLDSLDISFAVQAVNDCSGGVSVLSKVIVDGAGSGWVLYR
jgi:hypothetical protein